MDMAVRWMCSPIKFAMMANLLVIAAVFSADDLAQKFQLERAEAEKSGAGKLWPAFPINRADDLARQAQALQQAGRSAEAARLFRLARWSLPAVPPNPPDHLTRIFGDARLRHGNWVTAVAYSRNGQLLASASLDGSVRLWNLANGRLLVDYRGHNDKVRAVAFLPDGNVASAGGKDIRIWDAKTGQDRKTIPGATGYIASIAVSSDGQQLVASGEDRTIRVFDIEKGAEIHNLGVLSSLVYGVAWSRDGRFIGAVNGEGQLVVWDVKSKDRKRVLDQRAIANGGSYGLCFTPDQRTVAICGERSAKLIVLPSGNEDDAAGTVRRSIDSPTGHTDLITALAISADGKWLATGHRDRAVRLWNIVTGQMTRSFFGHSEEVSTVAFSPDGQQLASAGQDQSIRLWDLEPQPPALAMSGHQGPVWSITMSPDGKRLATAGADKVVRIWNTANGQQLSQLTGHTRPITAAVFTANGQSLITAAGDKDIKIWPMGGSGPRDLSGSVGAVLSLAMMPNGKTLLSGGADRKIRLWNVESGQSIDTWAGHNSAITGIAVRSDGQQVASVSADGLLKIRQSDEGRELMSVRAHDVGGAAAVAYSPNGQTLATVGGDKNLKLWRADGKTREPMATIPAHSGPISTVAFHPNGQWLATGGADGVVKVWDGSSRSEVQSFRGLNDWVTTVAFSPDGTMIAAANTEGKTLMWQLEKTAETGDVVHHVRKVTAIGGAGQRLLTGSDDGSLIVWNATTGQGTALPAAHSGAVIAVAVAPDGKRAVSSGYDRKVRVWDLDQMKETRAFDVNDRVYALSFSDGNVLAWQSRPGTDDDTTSIVQSLDVASGKIEDVISEKGKAAKSLSFSANGKFAVVGAPTGKARIWQLDDKKKMAEDWSAHGKPVHDVAITPNKQHVISADQDGEVCIWKFAANPGEALAKIETGIPAVIGLAVASTGQRAAVFGIDGGIVVLDIPGGTIVRKWNLRTRLGGATFTADGRQLATANADGTIYLLDLSE